MASKLNINSAEFAPSSVIEPSPIAEPTPVREYTVTLEPDASKWINEQSESKQKFLLSKIEGFKRSATKEKYDIVVSIGKPYDFLQRKEPFRNASIRYLNWLIDPDDSEIRRPAAEMVLGYRKNRKDPEFAKAGDELMKEFSERTGIDLRFKRSVRYDGVFCNMNKDFKIYDWFYDKTDNITYALTYALTCAVAEMYAIGNIYHFWKLNHEIVRYLKNKEAKYRKQFKYFADICQCSEQVEAAILNFRIDLNAPYKDIKAYREAQKSGLSP